MDELKFVLKSLVFACLLFAISQYRMDNGITIEAYMRGYLVSSSVADFVNQSAHGGVKLIKKLSNDVSEYTGLKKAEVQQRPIHSAVQKKKEQIDIEDDIDLE